MIAWEVMHSSDTTIQQGLVWNGAWIRARTQGGVKRSLYAVGLSVHILHKISREEHFLHQQANMNP